MSDTLFVVPMRGGSQGLPRKHLHLLDGMPVCTHVLRTLTPYGRVVVTTDDAEIAVLSREAGATVLGRPPELATPTIPLDPVVYWALKSAGGSEPIIATVQATSPLLQPATVATCTSLVRTDQCDTAMTVRDDRHVAWGGSLTAPSLATPWANRQWLPERWVMTGGCVVTKREFVTPERRFGGRIRLVEVSGAEAVDLDAPSDWALAEWYSGAPTSRETLMAKVLGEAPRWRGLTVILSAWAESAEEERYRHKRIAGEGSIIQIRGAHTRQEAEIAINDRGGHDDLSLVTSAYHQPRAFLTFLQVLKERGLERRVRLYNAPAPSRMDKLADEWRKIREYQAKGHCASYDDGLAYLRWRDEPVEVAA